MKRGFIAATAAAAGVLTMTGGLAALAIPASASAATPKSVTSKVPANPDNYAYATDANGAGPDGVTIPTQRGLVFNTSSELMANANIPSNLLTGLPLVSTGLTFTSAGDSSAYARVSSPVATIGWVDTSGTTPVSHVVSLRGLQVASTCRGPVASPVAFTNLDNAKLIVDHTIYNLAAHPLPNTKFPLTITAGDGSTETVGALTLNAQPGFFAGETVDAVILDVNNEFGGNKSSQELTLAASSCGGPVLAKSLSTSAH